jgi:hypothetical protein
VKFLVAPVEIARKALTFEEPDADHLTFKNFAWNGLLTFISVTIDLCPELVFTTTSCVPIDTEPPPVTSPATQPPVKEVFWSPNANRVSLISVSLIKPLVSLKPKDFSAHRTLDSQSICPVVEVEVVLTDNVSLVILLPLEKVTSVLLILVIVPENCVGIESAVPFFINLIDAPYKEGIFKYKSNVEGILPRSPALD